MAGGMGREMPDIWVVLGWVHMCFSTVFVRVLCLFGYVCSWGLVFKSLPGAVVCINQSEWTLEEGAGFLEGPIWARN